MMSNCFHLAIEGGKLTDTLPFYTDILGCTLGPSEEGKWQDIDFWGNELTLHETTPRMVKSPERGMHAVDMGAVCVPHFGIHLEEEDYFLLIAISTMQSLLFLPLTIFLEEL